nr:response regulator [Silvanigrella paludirubra]
MKKILIADASKASLVMTSEVFKDHYPGVQVLVARTSAEALEIAKNNEGVDAYVIDYDLPDADGAQTAARLKKLYSTPVLITAFDRPEVSSSIETTLKQYPDCQSWLKKPVNPEVVIAVVQRFCDGKIRTQKRIACNLPVFAEIILENESLEAYQQIITPQKLKKEASKDLDKKSPKGGKVVKKIATKKEIQKSIPIYFCGVVEDCSLSGVKLKPSKNNKTGLTDWNHLLASMEFISSGSSVILKLPSPSDIENGKMVEMTKVVFVSNEMENENNLLSEDSPKKKGTGKSVVSEAPKSKTSQKNAPALSTLSAVTKKKMTEKELGDRIQSMTGKVAWTSSESGEWCLGVEFESPSLSKRLFEAILSFQLKQQKNITNQSVMKTSRAG